MGIILDVILLLIFSMFVFIGYKKGLVKVVFGLIAIIVSLIITIILYRPITNLVIENTQIDENLSNMIQDKISFNKEQDKKEETNQFLDKYINDTKEDLENGIIKSSAEIISINIIGVSVLLILFIIIRIIVTIIGLITNKLADLPIIKQFNKAGGILYGIIEGLVIIYVVLAITFFIVSATNNAQIINIIDSSILTKFLYGNNLILKILF